MARMETLAREFYELERAEQERIRGAMELLIEDFEDERRRVERDRTGFGFGTVTGAPTGNESVRPKVGRMKTVGDMVEGVGKPSYTEGGSRLGTEVEGGSHGVGIEKVSSPEVLLSAGAGGGTSWEGTFERGMREKKEKMEKWRKFEISAGMELGEKNRYKNIWPFEWSRVKLSNSNAGASSGGSKKGDASQEKKDKNDYINASHIAIPAVYTVSSSPSSCVNPWIATQGPLESTFSDFWSMVWDQKIGLIVMLTEIMEGGREKCGKYFNTGTYGKYQLRIEKGSEIISKGNGFPNQMDFEQGFFDRENKKKEEGIVDRVLKVKRFFSEDGNPKGGRWEERTIRHVQYLNWPDFDVPPDPKELVDLVEVNPFLLSSISFGLKRFFYSTSIGNKERSRWSKASSLPS
jgi:protein tyrosine phosphatase